MVITDQVATAPCTDCVQVRFSYFEASKPPTALPRLSFISEIVVLLVADLTAERIV